MLKKSIVSESNESVQWEDCLNGVGEPGLMVMVLGRNFPQKPEAWERFQRGWYQKAVEVKSVVGQILVPATESSGGIFLLIAPFFQLDPSRDDPNYDILTV